MIELLLLAVAPVAGNPLTSPSCLPEVSGQSKKITSAIEDHRALRKAVGRHMPQTPTMVMLYGKGGHLSIQEYSIIVVRASDGTWQGTAMGRSQIRVKDAPYSPMKPVEWVLDKAAGRQLDEAISRRCPSNRKPIAEPAYSGPPLDFVPERIDVMTPGHPPSTFYAEEGEEIATLVRPPE